MGKQISKKALTSKKRKGEDAHFEGKWFCDCCVRNKRKWLGLKRYGREEDRSHGTTPPSL
jgi:hypothetical protein